MTDQSRHHVTSLIEMSDYCAAQLREFVKNQPQKLPQSVVLAATLKVCGRLANKQNATGVGELATRVSTYLQQRNGKLAVQNMEVEQLSLAAAWLEQLSRLHGSGLPWPQKQLADFQYSFDLLQKHLWLGSTVRTDMEAEQDDFTDLFADDPAPESPATSSVATSSAPKATDPFATDPEIDPVMELMQRTLRQVSVFNQPSRSDPFAADDEPTGLLSGDAMGLDKKTSDSTPDVDVFAGDPSADGSSS